MSNDPAQYPIELIPPDLSPYKAGNTGVDYFTTFDSGVDGPHVMVTALTHGNELCGAVALDHLLRNDVRPKVGRLTVGFCNVAAYETFDPHYPTVSRFVEEDFNRVWDEEVLDGPRDTVETRRARIVRPLLEDVDYLLDIHSMQHATTPLMLSGILPKGRELAEAIAYPEYVIVDAGHAAGRRMRDYGRFSDPGCDAAALLVECGQHWARSSGDVALETLYRFLEITGTISAELTQDLAPGLPIPPQKTIEITNLITVRSDSFQFFRSYVGMEVIEKAGTSLARDGDLEIRTPYDRCVLIMPSRRLGRGQTAVRLGRFL